MAPICPLTICGPAIPHWNNLEVCHDWPDLHLCYWLLLFITYFLPIWLALGRHTLPSSAHALFMTQLIWLKMSLPWSKQRQTWGHNCCWKRARFTSLWYFIHSSGISLCYMVEYWLTSAPCRSLSQLWVTAGILPLQLMGVSRAFASVPQEVQWQPLLNVPTGSNNYTLPFFLLPLYPQTLNLTGM